MIELNDKEAGLVSAAGLNPFRHGITLGDFEWQPNILDFVLMQTSLMSSGVLIGLALRPANPLEGLLSGGIIGTIALPLSIIALDIMDDIIGS